MPHNLFLPSLSQTETWVWVVLGLAVVVMFIVAMFILREFRLWLQAALSGAKVAFLDLIAMRFRNVNSAVIVLTRIQSVKAGLEVSTAQLETHYLARGHVPNVINAMIAADRAKIELPWDTACAIDLAGRDILDAVQTSVNPKVIDCPNPVAGKNTIDAVAQDGIQLKARARVTVRTNIRPVTGCR